MHVNIILFCDVTPCSLGH